MTLNYQQMLDRLYNQKTGYSFYRGLVSGVSIKNLAPASLPDLSKQDDPLTTSKTGYYNPIYGKMVNSWLNYEADPWRLISKFTYAQKGDSWRFLDTLPTNFYGQKEADTALGDSDIPEPTKATFTDPAQMYNRWNAKLIAQLKSTWQDSPFGDAEAYMFDQSKMQHPFNICEKLMLSADTPAIGAGSNDAYIESIDRVCSNDAESALLSAADDNDIYGFDRSAGEANAYVDLNGGVLRNLDLGDLDDMIAFCKKYSDRNRFILITDDEQLNTIEALDSTKQRYTENASYKISVINGVQTREGRPIGFPVSEYIGAGLKVPIFATQHTHNTGGGGGNIYLLDLDQIDIRVALPTVYLRTENRDFSVLDDLKYEYLLLTVAQLCASRFLCHGAIKYLN